MCAFADLPSSAQRTSTPRCFMFVSCLHGTSRMLAADAELCVIGPLRASRADTPKHPGATEPYTELQAMVATYTAGPVAPSDIVNGTNRELLLRSCTTAGDLLHPSRPATIMDAVLEARVFGDGPTGECQMRCTASPLNSNVVIHGLKSCFTITLRGIVLGIEGLSECISRRGR